MNNLSVWVALLLPLGVCLAAAPAGLKVRLDGPGTVAVESLDRYKVKIGVEAEAGREPLVLRVDLPHGGPDSWPAAEVEVRDAQGRAILVTRSGIEWDKLQIPVPAARNTYFVQAAGPVQGRAALPKETERHVTDEATGLSLAIAKWYDGRKAALSIRFDDSHPTHVKTAIPILREYGFRGTFMVNPGGRDPNSRRRTSFEDHRAEWEACARLGDQEFANHSLHHRGADGDDQVEIEIGEACRAIWDLFPGKSRLLALNLGGSTTWKTTRTLRYYLDKYHLFDASENSTGMDDRYGNRVANFRNMLEQRIAQGLWCQVHYHSIGPGLGCSEANFRAVLEIAKEHAPGLWIAGMTDIYKYQTERNASKLGVLSSRAGQFTFKLDCSSEAGLYDQPLTIEVTPPESWQPDRVEVKDQQGRSVAVRTVQTGDRRLLRFDAPPREAAFTVMLR
jgi:hypothetical protein